MSDDPKFVGVPPGEDPVIANYRSSVAARAKQQGEKQRVKIPNLAEAQVAFDPKKDNAMTLSQMGQAQENVNALIGAEEKGEKRKLSEGSVQGLQALYAAHGEQAAAAAAPAPEPPPPQPLSPQMAEVAAQTDDLELDVFMQRMQQDLINNDEQRALIDERVHPMNLGDGIATGEFKQHVPIKPGILEVTYRTVSPMEIEHIRRIVLELEMRDERLANLTVDRFALMQTVCSVVSINKNALTTHIKNPGTSRTEFLEEPFMAKYQIFSSYPGPFIHALSTHGYWFDLRVRALFTMDSLKNG